MRFFLKKYKVLRKNRHINNIFKFINRKKGLSTVLFSLFITGITTLILTLAYGIGYLFLYGYFFGGSTGNSPSLIQVFINPVPFNFYAVIISSILFIICVVLILYFLNKVTNLLQKGLRLNGELIGKIIISIILIVIFHFSLTVLVVPGAFGTNEITFFKVISFIGFWMTPINISISYIWMRNSFFNHFFSILSLLTALIIMVLCYRLIIKTDIINLTSFQKFLGIMGVNYVDLGLLFVFLISIILISPQQTTYKINVNGMLIRFMFFLTLSFIILGLLVDHLSLNITINGAIIIMTFFSGLLELLFINFQEKIILYQSQLVIDMDYKKLNFNKIKKTVIPFFTVLLLLFIVLVSNLIFKAGVYVRENAVNSSDNLMSEEIYFSKNCYKINGIIIADKNGIYYISNNSWTLTTLKNQSIISNYINPCSK